MKTIKGGIKKEEISNIRNNSEYKRKCKKCSEIKSFKKFSYRNDKNGLVYFGYECNKCNYKRKLKKYNNSITKYTEKQRYKENFTIKGRARLLRNRCKQRAKSYNMEFSLSLKNIINLLKNKVCQKTNINLIIDDSTYNPYAPSIDRIDNNKGYIDDNIQIVCMIYNFCKNKFTENQVDDFLKKCKND